MANTAPIMARSTFAMRMSTVSFRLFFLMHTTNIISVTMLPRTVAMAAPAAPIPSPKINKGSKIIFTILPAILPIMATLASPSVRSWLAGIKVRMMEGAPSAIQV